MTKGAFFIRPENGTLLAPDGFTTLAWPTEGRPTTTVISGLGWNLAPLHGITPQAADLVHLACGCRTWPTGARPAGCASAGTFS